MTPKRHGLRTDPNFTEDIVGFALESFLAFFTFPFFKYSIEPFSRGQERWLGADARLAGQIQGFSPIYLQFKRPHAYDAGSKSAIISGRAKLALPSTPRALFFHLRDKQEDHQDYQHNILLKLSMRLRKRGLGDAVYVCPLFLDGASYRTHLYLSAMSQRIRFWRIHPFELSDLFVNDQLGRFTLDSVPILSEHVCIRPHTRVANAKHSYSFTEAGTDVCFHSPVAVSDGTMPLSRWLEGAFRAFTESTHELRVTNENALTVLGELIAAAPEEPGLGVPESVTATKDGIEAWHRFGDFLAAEYSISQFAIVARK